MTSLQFRVQGYLETPSVSYTEFQIGFGSTRDFSSSSLSVMSNLFLREGAWVKSLNSICLSSIGHTLSASRVNGDCSKRL